MLNKTKIIVNQIIYVMFYKINTNQIFVNNVFSLSNYQIIILHNSLAVKSILLNEHIISNGIIINITISQNVKA